MSKKETAALLQLYRYMKPFRKKVLMATVFSIFNKLFDLAPPILIGAAVDIVVKGEESLIASLGIPDAKQQLLILGLITAIIWILESIFEYLFQIYWRDLAQYVQHNLRKDAYTNLQQQEMAFFEDQSSGKFITILNDDINQLERFLDHGANDIIQVLVTVLVIGTLFIVSAPAIGWIALLPMPFIIWGSIWFQKKLAPRYSNVREKASDISSQLVNNIGGISTIKSFGTEKYEEKRIEELSHAYKKANQNVIRLSAAFVPMIRMLILVGFIGILIFAGFRTLNGAMEIGMYSVLIFVTQRLLWPLTRLGETFDLYQRAMASTIRVLNILKINEHLQDGDIEFEKTNNSGCFKLKNVSFKYKSSNSVLHNINMEITSGQTVGIVGPTGAGKSSFIKVLMRMYDITNGKILLDNHDLRSYQLSSLVENIGFVSQDIFLFDGTVKDNLKYGSFEASEEEITSAAQLSEAHDFIMKLPQQYNTIVGERGQKLSGGQRQRIALARAILKNPPILILDEATSAVDNETEAAIQKSLQKVAKDRTTIIIAHRLSTIRHADNIIVLDKGLIVEQGRHEELLNKRGIYHQLWKAQSGEMMHF